MGFLSLPLSRFPLSLQMAIQCNRRESLLRFSPDAPNARLNRNYPTKFKSKMASEISNVKKRSMAIYPQHTDDIGSQTVF